MTKIPSIYQQESGLLFSQIKSLIESARARVANYANSALVLLYWQIGKQVDDNILQNEKAGYGEGIIKTLAQQLTAGYGSGYDARNLFRMVKFARLYPEQEKVVTLSPLLSWSHFVKLISIEDTLKRDYYVEMCKPESWSVRELRQKIDNMTYERTMLAKKPEEVIEQELSKLKTKRHVVPDMLLKDPYILNFLNLGIGYEEKGLEDAILNELTRFIQELGSDFCFVTRQKRMSTEKTDRYLDLLFFHRRLRRLIAIELKLSAFQPEHKGQMEWYLRWLDKHERRPGEESPLGIILCADKDQEDIELLELDKSGIHVAAYLTELPPKEILEDKLHKAIAIARERFARKEQMLDVKHQNDEEK